MKYESIENLYIIRIAENEELRASKLEELEELLQQDERAKLEYVIEPISSVIAFLYDTELVIDLALQGYELIPQCKNFEIAEFDQTHNE